MQKILYLSLVFFMIPFYVYSNIIPYENIDEQLEKTWNASFPVKYTKIIKKNPTTKGILVYKNNQKLIVYIYSFILFLPNYYIVDKTLQTKEEGKEITVKLIYDPNSDEKTYTIDLSRFDEQFETSKIVKWIK